MPISASSSSDRKAQWWQLGICGEKSLMEGTEQGEKLPYSTGKTVKGLWILKEDMKNSGSQALC